jgi:3-oxoadipate enol-lactonase
MRFRQINGGVVHFADEGPRHAPAIVFINSLGTDYRIWDDVAGALALERRVIRFDKRGHGLSTHARAAVAIADFAGDLGGLLDHLRSGAATIIGVSIGGLIAQELYRLRPDLVASLVLCDTGRKIGTPEFWAMRLGAVDAGGIEAIADGLMQRWFSQDYRDRYPDMVAGWRAMVTRTPKDGYLAACRAIRDADLTDSAKRIRVPTLVVTGDQDLTAPPEMARELASLIPGAEVEIVAGAGHLPCIEKPEALRALIDVHLKEFAP